MLWLNKLTAQKRPLQISDFQQWPSEDYAGDYARATKTSDDGKYVSYVVKRSEDVNKLVLLSTVLSRRAELQNITFAAFSPDNKKMLFVDSLYKLGSVYLEDFSISYFEHSRCNLEQFVTSPTGTLHDWIIYEQDIDSSIIILNLVSGEERRFKDISSYHVSHDASAAVLEFGGQLKWVDFSSGRAFDIVDNFALSNIEFFATGDAIFSGRYNGGTALSVCYFKPGMTSAKVIIDSVTCTQKGINLFYNFTVNEKNGSLVFGYNVAKPATSDFELKSKPNIQSYLTPPRYSGLLGYIKFSDLSGNKDTLAVISNESDVHSYVSTDGQFIAFEGEINNKFPSVSSIEARPNLYLMDVRDRKRILVDKRAFRGSIKFSPNSKYLTWYDGIKCQWFACCTRTNKVVNISAFTGVKSFALNVSRSYSERNWPVGSNGIAGWLKYDSALLIYDQFDIWQLDPTGKAAPINLTQYCGSKNNVSFRIIGNNLSDTLFLLAFNTENKESGFYQLLIREKKLIKLSMAPVACNYLCKARSSQQYVVEKMSEKQYPNLYVTSDFKTFLPLTNFEPQRNFNWYSTELVHYTLANGSQQKAIMYKPENFDPTKKYPVIFYYYEEMSDKLHEYLVPSLSVGTIDIPWYVSNGYIVCSPDIVYKWGYPGESALNCIVSCAKHLSKQPWVDGRHMGLQGFSFGGFETNYILAHSNMFAAAAAGAGPCDIVSLANREKSSYDYYITGQGRIRSALWEKPDLYVKNSPVFNADKVSTPLLILQNQNDGSTPFTQATEWFNELTSLGKKAWLISYSKEGHTISNKENRLDYSIRMLQFFDHYLKGKPAPRWMTEVINPLVDGDNGLELPENYK